MIQSEEGSGQHIASTSDVRAIVDTLLRQHQTFIVIDGVDECNNPEALLEEVRDVCIEHDCRVILLGRPSTPIPRRWTVYMSTDNWRIELGPSSVSRDIACYLQDNLSHLITHGFLGNGVKKFEHLLQLTDMNLIPMLADAAEGIFLWAKVLLNLLQSPALSPAARLSILQKPANLVSLDALYRRMLDMIEASSWYEQELAQKVFRWLLFSTMALHTTSFHTTLAIHPGRPTTERDYLNEYPQCIPRITCFLVELHTDRDTFVFLHLSFKDFLLHKVYYDRRLNGTTSKFKRSANFPSRKRQRFDSQSWNEGYQESEEQCRDINDLVNQRAPKRRDRSSESLSSQLGLEPERRSFLQENVADVRGSQLALAETCLSYLIFDIPAQPLQALRKDKPFCGFGLDAMSNTLEASYIDADMITNGTNRQSIDVQYPFLRYSALCWQHHLAAGHYESNPTDQSFPRTSELYITLLSQFLVNPFAATMWTEASYHYRMVPQMGRLDQLIKQFTRSRTLPTPPIDDIRAREHAWVGIGLHQLSEALRHLAEHSSSRLLQNPSLIWQKDIQRAKDNKFWPNWEGEEEIKGIEVDGEGLSQQGSWRFDHDVAPAPSLA
ncbi:hypothetical protein EV127DRAFT_449111 [Xylaria flabelliformis]|nr:hypothetical protein EV127DRAFT_449111 [Xylaria flabelliformis]